MAFIQLPFRRNSNQLALGLQKLYGGREKKTREFSSAQESLPAREVFENENFSWPGDKDKFFFLDRDFGLINQLWQWKGNIRQYTGEEREKTVDAAIQTSADVTVLKDQKESAKTVSQTSALKVPSHKYPTRTKLAGRSSGKLQPAILSPVPTSSTSAYREERAISVLRPGLGSSSTPCTDTRTSNEEANDRRSSGSKFVSSEIAEGISAQIVSALVQSLKMNIPTIS